MYVYEYYNCWPIYRCMYVHRGSPASVGYDMQGIGIRVQITGALLHTVLSVMNNVMVRLDKY